MRVMNKLLTATATVGLLLVSGSAQAREPRAAVTNGWAGYIVTHGRPKETVENVTAFDDR